MRAYIADLRTATLPFMKPTKHRDRHIVKKERDKPKQTAERAEPMQPCQTFSTGARIQTKYTHENQYRLTPNPIAQGAPSERWSKVGRKRKATQSRDDFSEMHSRRRHHHHLTHKTRLIPDFVRVGDHTDIEQHLIDKGEDDAETYRIRRANEEQQRQLEFGEGRGRCVILW